MYRKILTYVATLLLLFSAAAQKRTAGEEEVLRCIVEAQRPQEGQTEQYAFRQTRHTPLLKEEAVMQGMLTLKGGKNMRWEYTQPERKAFIVEGDSLFSEQGGVRQKMRGAGAAQMKGIMETMMRLTSGEGLTDERLFSLELRSSDGTHHVHLTPKRRDMRRMMQSIEIEFSKKDCKIERLRMTDGAESYTIIEFERR